LTEIIRQYYEIFPDELEGQEPSIKMMLTQGDIYKRDKPIMEMLVNEGIIKKDKADIIVELIVRTQESYLLDAFNCKNESEVKVQSEKFMNLFNYLIESGK